MARSVNKVIIIGNLTRDPELRYTPNGQAVSSFGVATNRNWVDKAGEKKEDVEFHNVVAWGKLAELTSQLLKKGRKVFIEGRLQTRSWEGKDGVTRQRTEIITEDMVVLDRREVGAVGEGEAFVAPEEVPVDSSQPPTSVGVPTEASGEPVVEDGKTESGSKKQKAGKTNEEIDESEIPF